MFWKKKQFWGTLVALALLIYCVKDIRLEDIKTLSHRLDLFYLIPSIICAFLFIYFKAIRWGVMVSQQKVMPHFRMVSLYSAGQILNIVMPMLTGQVGRMFLFSKNEGFKKTFIFSTIILEILFDAVSLLILLVITSLVFVFPEEYRTAGYIVAIVTVVVIVLLYLILSFQNKLEDFCGRCFRNKYPSFHIGLKKFIRSFVQGLNLLKSSKHFSRSMIYSILSWIFHMLVILFLLKSFGMGGESVTELMVISSTVVIINTLALMVPISPGNAGTFEFAVSTTLAAFRIGRTDAVLFALALHLLDLLPIAVLGYIYLHMEKISISKIKEAHEDDDILDRVSEDGTLIDKDD